MSNNVGGVRKYFCAIMVPQSPIGLISAEIGALYRILGHANVCVENAYLKGFFVNTNSHNFGSNQHFFHSFLIWIR